MSEKKSKLNRQTMSMPIYSVENQIDWLKNFCEPFNFDVNTLTSYLIADFIYTIENGVNRGAAVTDLFFSYLLSVQKTHKKFIKLQERMNGKN